MDWNEDGKKDLVVGDSTGVIYLFINEGSDKDPVLSARKQLVVGGSPFKWKALRTKPEVVDWNNDGKKDILFGEERGSIQLLLNTGTNEEPVFDSTTSVLENGAALRAPSSRPDVCVYDWNGDGKKDMIVTCEDGKVYFYENKGSDAEPEFKGHVTLKSRSWSISAQDAYTASEDLDGDGTKETIGCTRTGDFVIKSGNTDMSLELNGKTFNCKQGKCSVKVVDWNGDNLLDILIGNADGNVYIAENKTKKKGLEFAELTPVKASSKPINGGIGVIVDYVDFDKDGKKDILCIDCNGAGTYYPNSGSEKKPKFKKGKAAEAEPSEICFGFRSRVDVADWDGDGFADLIYGVTSRLDNAGRVYVFPGKRQ